MLISEIVNKTGLSRDTIRFYEKQGLIKINRKERRENNYKEYSEENLQRLITIKLLKSFGFTLNECSEVLFMIEVNQATCTNISSMVAEKVDLIDRKIEELINVKMMLLKSVENCKIFSNSDKMNVNCHIISNVIKF